MLLRSQKYYQSHTNHTVNHNIHTPKHTLIKIHVAMSAETRQFLKYLYVLFIYSCFFFPKFYFVVKPERPIATIPLVRPGWTICCEFLQLINSIDIPLGTNQEATPPILIPNQCCISSRLFFTVTTTRPVLQYRNLKS